MDGQVRYAGFWRRVGASLVDTLLLVIVLVPLALLLRLLGGAPGGLVPLLLNDLLPMVLIIYFWVRFRGTPGKRLLECQVVDARTLKSLTVGQGVLRYLGYVASALPLGLGFLWIVWDPRKQGFHDKIAGTLVLHRPGGSVSDEDFGKTLQQLMKEAS